MAKQKAIQEEQASIEKEREQAECLEKERKEKERLEKEKEKEIPQLIAESKKQEYEQNETRTKLADVFGTNRQYINEAKKLKETSPEKFEAVKNGEKNLICVYANKVFIVLLIPTF